MSSRLSLQCPETGSNFDSLESPNRNTEEIEKLKKIFEEIKVKLELDPNKISDCRKHFKNYEFYCISCESCCCDNCIVRGGDHSGHIIDRLNTVYDDNVSNVMEAVYCAKVQLEDINQVVPKEMEKQIDNVKKVKEKMVRKINLMCNEAISTLNKQADEKISLLSSQKHNFILELENLRKKFQELENTVILATKPDLISNQSELFGVCRKITEKSSIKLIEYAEGIEFKSTMIPEFLTGEIKIENFSKTKTEEMVIYSTEIKDDLGTSWRLRIDPNDFYLSVYIELKGGVLERYEFSIELLNAIPSKIVKIEGEMDFKQTKCWGRAKFIQIEKLYSEGFLNEQDMLVFRFSVRPSNIVQKSVCQQKCIENLRKKLASATHHNEAK